MSAFSVIRKMKINLNKRSDVKLRKTALCHENTVDFGRVDSCTAPCEKHERRCGKRYHFLDPLRLKLPALDVS